MLVEPTPELVEIFVAAFAQRFDAHLTCVSTAAACLDTEIINPHDLVIADLNLEDSDGVDLAGELCALSSRPVILTGSKPRCSQIIEALRIGVKDVLVKPFPLIELLESADRALIDYSVHRKHLARYHSMRGLVRRVLKERRSMTQRVELICRDLVGAHRRLVHRVLSTNNTA